MKLSVILPARNEAASLESLLPRIRAAENDAEIIVVDDASEDATPKLAADAGARLISHPYPLGNGAAIKAGARVATGDVLIFMDADGQHDPADIPRLLNKLAQGYDMVVGARHAHTHASLGRGLANAFYNWFASLMTGHRIEDLTSGFRAVYAANFKRFIYLLPNGFSYPTTITMAFFRSGNPVGYVPIRAARRCGNSHTEPYDRWCSLCANPVQDCDPLFSTKDLLPSKYWIFSNWLRLLPLHLPCLGAIHKHECAATHGKRHGVHDGVGFANRLPRFTIGTVTPLKPLDLALLSLAIGVVGSRRTSDNTFQCRPRINLASWC